MVTVPAVGDETKHSMLAGGVGPKFKAARGADAKKTYAASENNVVVGRTVLRMG
ncbi:MAG: hypothetical protein DHS20C11_20910 [Lysobacteraceae bacterium]|nr:MAG: hypothetical protein DHS20C11_20910 [Xanthomonadaceae bacterium]